jgi:sulfur dioxygenase
MILEAYGWRILSAEFGSHPLKGNTMFLRQLYDADTSTYTYLVADESTRKAALIDPVREALARDLALVQELGFELVYVFETHVHADHVTSAGTLAERTGAATAASALGAECATTRLRHGDVLKLGVLEIKALATPGHTKDSLSFLIEDNVFTGDALLVRGTGRTDFQSGDAGELYDSITKTLFSLPDSTKVWPGHDYRGHTQSSIGEERRHNPRVANKTRDEFTRIMGELRLAPPNKIQEAVPANLACGRDRAVASA